MKICERLKSIFKSSSSRDKKDDDEFLKALRRDISDANLSAEDFEKKFKKLMDSRIKKISSMTGRDMHKENEMITLAFKVFSDNDQIYQVAPLIARKINLLRPHLKDYQEAIRKNIEK